jgi:hypothetical protein
MCTKAGEKKNQQLNQVKLISADNLDELINLLHNEAKVSITVITSKVKVKG